jgi:peptidoglycan-associated lipoprotein
LKEIVTIDCGEKMKLSVPMTLGIAVVLIAGACSSAPPAVVVPVVNQDSIDAANARRDSLRMANEAARREEQARVAERETAARQAAAEAEEAARQANDMVRNVFASTIHFDYDRSEIKDEFVSGLEMKVMIMNANPTMRISISGHADERGSDEYNIALGNRRAMAAKTFMVDRGIAEDRIDTSTMGESQPMVDESNEAAWEQNRRDEFEVLGMENLVRPQM